jgi:hypothetical protein
MLGKLGTTLMLATLAKAVLEHSNIGTSLGRVYLGERVRVWASYFVTAVCPFSGRSDQSLNIFALALYRRGGSTEQIPKQAAPGNIH